MKTMIITAFLLMTTNAFAAPSAAEVAAAILGDSGMESATNITDIQYNFHRSGDSRQSEHSLQFNFENQVYKCESFNLITAPAGPGEHFVSAKISGCANAADNKLVFRNDYTDQQGNTLFKRIFFNDNKRFRKPKEQDEKFVQRVDLQHDRRPADASVRVVHTNDLEDGILLIDSAGQLFPIN